MDIRVGGAFRITQSNSILKLLSWLSERLKDLLRVTQLFSRKAGNNNSYFSILSGQSPQVFDSDLFKNYPLLQIWNHQVALFFFFSAVVEIVVCLRPVCKDFTVWMEAGSTRYVDSGTFSNDLELHCSLWSLAHFALLWIPWMEFSRVTV